MHTRLACGRPWVQFPVCPFLLQLDPTCASGVPMRMLHEYARLINHFRRSIPFPFWFRLPALNFDSLSSASQHTNKPVVYMPLVMDFHIVIVICLADPTSTHKHATPTARGFEPLRAEPNGFLVHHLKHSVTLSCLASHAGAHLVAQLTSSSTVCVCVGRGRNIAATSVCAWLRQDEVDTEGIRTPAGRAQWISSPSP